MFTCCNKCSIQNAAVKGELTSIIELSETISMNYKLIGHNWIVWTFTYELFSEAWQMILPSSHLPQNNLLYVSSQELDNQKVDCELIVVRRRSLGIPSMSLNLAGRLKLKDEL